MLVVWIAACLASCNAQRRFTDRPRLESIDGNLYIVAAQDRNLTLSTSGRGRITVNGEDVQEVINGARNVARAASSKNRIIDSIRDDIQKLVSERQSIYRRLSSCESAYAGVNSSVTLPKRGSSAGVVSSWLENIKRRVEKIEFDLRRNECSPGVRCKNGGRCIDLYLTFLCLCPDGWEGVECKNDVNECTDFINTDLGCQNGATCVNKPGSYECVCPPGFFGKHCSTNRDDCSSGSSAETCDHGTCVNKIAGRAGHDCICDQGWEKSPGGVMCSVDVNECLKAPCSRSPKVNCINIPGGFRCESCPAGYTGNGFICEDFDECLNSNGGCSLTPRVNCINTIGSFTCGSCPPGYAGDGVTCSYVGKCNVNHGGCHPQATCQEVAGNVVCTCSPGAFTGDGIGPYGCISTGLAFSGVSTPCSSNPCVNGRCIPVSATNYSCECFMGYSGANCQFSRSPCETNPCANGGTCRRVDRNSYKCICTREYTGIHCRQERMVCGGSLRGDEGELQFPNTPNVKYLSNRLCAWRINVNSSLIIQLTFDTFDLQPSNKNGECVSDWLQIYDGADVGHHNMLGRFCGNSLPNNGTLLSTDHYLLIWFRSDGSSNHMGFKLRWNATEPRCGGRVDGRVHGTLTSPGAPGLYPKNRDCFWRVSTFFNQRITFTFFKLNIENHSNCSYDYLEIFEGGKTEGSPLMRYCTTDLPAPLITPGPEATIHFHSDGISSDRGFQISYSPTPGIPGCGGIFTDQQGQIRPVLVDDNYKSDMDCVWLIRIMPSLQIKAVIEKMDIEKLFGDCRHDFLEIRDGDNENAPLYGKFCGSEIPAPITSSGNTLYIRFHTDKTVTAAGFVLTYQEVCNLVFPEPTGTISSPDYPNQYKHGFDCYYTIDQPVGKAIRLDFQDFDVETKLSFGHICFDFLEVHDGANIKAPTLLKTCGNKRPGRVISTHNKLHLWFHSDSSIAGVGWAANYSTFDTLCGGVLTSLKGNISSLTHPDGYPPNIICNWVIALPPGQQIQVTFLSFNLEKENMEGKCAYDYVALYDNSTNHQLMTRLCGRDIPPPITSVGNIITIQFKTDDSAAGDGFQIEYEAVDVSKICRGNYFSSTGALQSPNYPDNYPDGKICAWTINVPDGQKIRLTPKNFSLEYSFDCQYDYLEIRNGNSENSPLIDKYCGRKPPPVITSFSNSLFLKFSSDSLHTFPGFLFLWDGSLTGCGGYLTGASGSITSPNYPAPYVSNLDCFYSIRTSLGSNVKLLFVDLELEESDECTYDYIQLFDGPDEKSKSIGKYCGSVSDTDRITSSGNQLYIKFHSDRSHGGKGFSLRYNTDCNVRIGDARRGVIESPNYPAIASTNMNCTWTITPLPMHTINFTFADFTMTSNIFNSGNCTFNYPQFAKLQITENEVHSNALSSTELLGQFCSGVDPPRLISSRQITDSPVEIAVTFTTSIFFRTSFRLEWVEDGCGGRLTRDKGDFSSPGYPDPYPRRVTCVWEIAVDRNKAIFIKFENINVAASVQCRDTFISVYGGADESAPLLSKFCDEHRDLIILQSSGNNMYVVFHSNLPNQDTRRGRGFSAKYWTVSSRDCGGVFIAPTGQIHSMNYPKNYGQHDDCSWFIRSDGQHNIQLTFTDFDLVRSADCNDTFVEVYDGRGRYSPIVLRACGNALPNSTIVSHGSVLMVRMRSSSQMAAKGFLAEYTWRCGGTIIVRNGGIFRPSYLHSTECWVSFISPETDGHVTLSVYSDADVNNDTAYPFATIFEGDGSNTTKLGVVPSENAQTSFTSNGNAITVQFIYPKMLVGTMQVAYSSVSSACGGHLSALTGTIASPGYPGSYPVGIECVWFIPAAPGNNVQLSFKTFVLQSSVSCNLDSVEVRRSNGEGALLGTFCGSAIPEILTDAGLWVKFSSNGDGEVGSGFSADYSLVFTNDINGTKGSLASPLYPHPFRSSLDQPLSWRITAPDGQKILLTFKDFVADRRIQSTYLTIYDGYDTTAAETEFVGSPLPVPFKSTSSVVFLQMKASPELKDDDAFAGSHFYLDWHAITNEPRRHTWNPAPCGEDIFMGSNQTLTIRSPNYPGRYPSYARCTWVVRAPPGHHLSYRILNLDIYESPECAMASLKFFDGEKISDEKKPQHVFCLKNETHDINSRIEVGDVLTVVFTSWYDDHGTGFEIFIQQEVGGVFEGSEGVFSLDVKDFASMPYNTDYFEWRIVVGRGRRVNVTFDEFSVGALPDGSCSKTYVSLRNGHHADSPPLGRGQYCGAKPSNIPLTTSNDLFVKAKGQVRNPLAFKLHFKEVQYTCGGRLELTDNVKSIEFTTPNYPHSPHPRLECIWLVKAPLGKIIQIDFIGKFDLNPTSDCSVEYVEIRDGQTELAATLGKYCSETPNVLLSSDNMLYVKYYTNATDPNNGFKASVSIDKCGSVIRLQKGVITTPGYPTLTEETLDCTWTFHTNIRKLISFSLTDFDIADANLPRVFRAPAFPGILFPYINNLNNIVVIYEDGLPNKPTPFRQRPSGWPSPWHRREYMMMSRFNRDTPQIVGFFYKGARLVPVTSTKNTVHIRVRLNNTRGFRGVKIGFKSVMSECGGKLFTPDGFISSPRYPQMQPKPMYCEWTIQVPIGRRISVKFEDFDFLDSSMGQKLIMSNDVRDVSVIGVFNRSSPPSGIYKSSGNIMAITYISNLSTGPVFRGFKLKYSSDEAAACGAIVNATEITLEQPENLTTFNCLWHFPTATSINVSHLFFIENVHVGNRSLSCTYLGNTGIFVNADGVFPVYMLCSNVQNKMVGIALGNIKLSAIAASYTSSSFTFRIKYKRANCGGYVTDIMLPYTITSPDYPDPYPNSVDCVWRFSTSPGQTLKMTFNDFELNKSCQDLLIIHGGPSSGSPLLGTYCTAPDGNYLVSEGESLFVHFHSETHDKAKGFNITIDANHTECGGIIRSTYTKLKSPNYPEKYGNDVECEWIIMAEPGSHIGLVFMERFQLEDSVDCKNDSVQVFDYIDGDWGKPTVFCGRNMPPAINSTGTQLKVLFRSNADVVGDGFKARWESNCGGVLTEKSGIIFSPNFPSLYPNNRHCQYKIVNKEKLLIEFKYFDLEPAAGGKCTFDYLEIEEQEERDMGMGTKSKRSFCGSNLPEPIESKKNILITFHTDYYVQRRGFKLYYTVDECGGPVTKPTVITRQWTYPTYGKPCNWSIEAPTDMVVGILFTDVILPEEKKCRWGSIVIKESDQTTKATICGTHNSPIPIASSSNKLSVALNRYMLQGNFSFTAIVSFNYRCGGTITVKDNPELLVSPDIDRDGYYENFLNCHWIIKAPASHFLTVKFLTMDINNCNTTNCSCDFVEIRDGNGPLSDLIQKTCGGNITEAVSSSSNVLWIWFKTDGSRNGKGFTLQLSSRISPCGLGHLTATTNIQKIISPNYPENYPANTRCSWLIVAQPPNISLPMTSHMSRFGPRLGFSGHRQIYIHLQLRDWNIEESQDCQNDYVTLEDYPSSEQRDGSEQYSDSVSGGGEIYVGRQVVIHRHMVRWTPLGRSKYCGSNKFADFYAPSGRALVRFISNEDISGAGFSLEYSTNICGRNYTGNQGRIRLNYIQPNLPCDLSIEAPFPNHTISLYFGRFYTRTSDNCTNGYFSVKEGFGKEVLKACSYNLPSPLFSTGPKLILTAFDPDGVNIDIDITYTTTDQGPGCGGTIENHAGVFTSPLYPGYVRNNTVCKWLVFVPEDLSVNMYFSAFDLGSSSTCATDFVEFFNCNDFGEILNLHSRFCGGDEPGVIKGTGNVMAVKYTRSVNNGGSGWLINFVGLAPGYSISDD